MKIYRLLLLSLRRHSRASSLAGGLFLTFFVIGFWTNLLIALQIRLIRLLAHCGSWASPLRHSLWPAVVLSGLAALAFAYFVRWSLLRFSGKKLVYGGLCFALLMAVGFQTHTFPALDTNNIWTGNNTFLGLLNCKNLEASIFYIDTANTQGWAGADDGARFNSAITAWPSTGAQLIVASGQYTITTPITGAQDGTILCPTGGSTTSGVAALNFIPATGNLITWSNSAVNLIGCTLKTTTSTTSVALKLSHATYSTNIDRNHIIGFFGGLQVTGDGASAFSRGVHITNNLIDGLNANCGGGNGYGVSFDHVQDLTYDKNEVYSVTDCATGFPMIMDTGTQGVWMSGSTFEQGKNAGIIRNTSQGGAYGGAPAAIFADGITWDLPPGGDALLFDSTLGTSDIRFFCSICWAAGAGKNNANAVVTAGAVGFNVQGGSNIHFTGGTSRVNASWGALVNTSGQNISFENVNFHANNQGNTAGVGGIKIAVASGWRIEGVRSGNIIESGGNQAWGVDISGASTNGVLSGNDLRNNTSGRINYPAGIAQAGVDAPEFGSGTGLHFYGPTMLLEQTAPSGVAGEEVCYGDSTAHVPRCNYNGGTNFHGLRVTEVGTCTMAAGTCTVTWGAAFNATPIVSATWNGTGTLTTGASLKCTATTTNSVCTSSTGTDTAVIMVTGTGNPN